MNELTRHLDRLDNAVSFYCRRFPAHATQIQEAARRLTQEAIRYPAITDLKALADLADKLYATKKGTI